jgi:hypothetical protein
MSSDDLVRLAANHSTRKGDDGTSLARLHWNLCFRIRFIDRELSKRRHISRAKTGIDRISRLALPGLRHRHQAV